MPVLHSSAVVTIANMPGNDQLGISVDASPRPYVAGADWSGLCRSQVLGICDVSINTVSKLLVDAGNVCAAFHHENVRGVTSKSVQCDEIASRVASKFHGSDSSDLRSLQTRLTQSGTISPCGCPCAASRGSQMRFQRNSTITAMHWQSSISGTTGFAFIRRSE